MSDSHKIASNANEAAELVLHQAMEAAAQGTFAVGGCIIENATGKVIKVLHNNVLRPLPVEKGKPKRMFTYDPTAHGERQLVSWYYENKVQLNLPEPKDLTIVTTLDPCVMCTGALLTAGFNVAVVAIDDFAGINYNSRFTFKTLPKALRDTAKSTFGYYACGDKNQDPAKYVRDYVGGEQVVFKDTVVKAANLAGCGDIFGANVENVRKNSSESGLEPEKLTNPAKLADDSPIKVEFRKVYANAFKLKVDNFRLPTTELRTELENVKNAQPNAKNAVALLDPFGNVVLCFADTTETSLIQTAFMNVTQKYAHIRFELMEDIKTRDSAYQHLTHPKYGTFVFLYAPNPNDTTTIMTLGAYGSTMEGPIPQVFPSNFQYFNPPLEGTIEELTSAIMNLPPFYTKLAQVSIAQTASTHCVN